MVLQNHIVNFRNFIVLLKVYFIIVVVSIVSSLKLLLSAVPKEHTSENNLPTDSLVQVSVNENSANVFMLLQDTFSTFIFLKISFHFFLYFSPSFIPLFAFTVNSYICGLIEHVKSIPLKSL